MKINNAASFSLNTIAINVLYIDGLEDNAYSLKWLIWSHSNIRIPASVVLKFTILVDLALVIINLFLVCLNVPGRREEECIFTIWHEATPYHKNRCPRGHEIYNFGRPFLGYYYYILSLPDLCLEVEKKIFKEVIYSHWLIWPCPSLRTPAQGVMKVMILVDPSLVIYTIYIVCLIYDWGLRRF